jgi:hypothetical protein
MWEVSYPIGAEWQGKEMIYDVGCSAHFPHGRGIVVSHGRGMRVGEIRSDGVEMLRKGAVFLLSGHAVFTRPSSFRAVLPTNVRSSLSGDPVPSTTILDTWDPDAPDNSRDPER